MYLKMLLLQVSRKITIAEQLLMNAFELCFPSVSDVFCIWLLRVSSLNSEAFILQSLTSILRSYAVEPLMCKEVCQQR